MDSDFIKWVIIHYHPCSFWCSDCPRFGQWELTSSWLLWLSFFEHNLSSGTRWSRLILPSPGVFLLGIDIWTQDLGTTCAHCHWGVITHVLLVDRLKKKLSFHVILAFQFYNCSYFLSLQEAWLPRKSINLLFCSFYNTYTSVSELLCPYHC